ncbi:MAG: WYL domain-containing protein [Microthrixaceae bacterium]
MAPGVASAWTGSRTVSTAVRPAPSNRPLIPLASAFVRGSSVMRSPRRPCCCSTRRSAAAVLNEDPGLRVHERREDGAVVLALTVRNPVALRGFVLNLLDRAELLSPERMRQDLIDSLIAMAGEEAP